VQPARALRGTVFSPTGQDRRKGQSRSRGREAVRTLSSPPLATWCEWLNANQFLSIDDATIKIEACRDDYEPRRPRSLPGDVTHDEYVLRAKETGLMKSAFSVSGRP
jgi:hypothetical protein